jgi:hypothetical protein
MTELARGRVIQVDAKLVHVDLGAGRVVPAALRGALVEERTAM